MSKAQSQRGIRFAPSPTGRFHLGNLRTAWISWRIAKLLGQPWVCRFEDIDRPRVLEGALEEQLADLRALGMVPDEVLIQSDFHDRHLRLFIRAKEARRVYPCFCSRKEVLEALRTAASAPHRVPPVYNGKCRRLSTYPSVQHPTVAWRFAGEDPGGSQDFIIGRTNSKFDGRTNSKFDGRTNSKFDGRTNSACEDGELAGDWTSSFVPAYNWACAIDDYDGGYALLVRAWDLSHVVQQQRAIHGWLSETEKFKPVPAVFHCSLVVGPRGERLEKRTRGITLPELSAAGISEQAILDGFARSFVDGSDVSGATCEPDAISGEEKEIIPLTLFVAPG